MSEGKEKSFETEYKETADKLIFIIDNARFVLERRGGYNPEQADEFLDNLVLEITKHGMFKNVSKLINTTIIADVKFGKTKMGYNVGAFDDFLDLLELEIEKLNVIKLRYL